MNQSMIFVCVDHLWWTKGSDPSPLAQAGVEGDEKKARKHKKHKKEKKKHKKGKKKKASRRRSDSDDSRASAENPEKQALKKHDEVRFLRLRNVRSLVKLNLCDMIGVNGPGVRPVNEASE